MSEQPNKNKTLDRIISRNYKLFETAGILFGVAAFVKEQVTQGENIYASIASALLIISAIVIIIDIYRKEGLFREKLPLTTDIFFTAILFSMASMVVYGISAFTKTTDWLTIFVIEITVTISIIITALLLKGFDYFYNEW